MLLILIILRHWAWSRTYGKRLCVTKIWKIVSSGLQWQYDNFHIVIFSGGDCDELSTFVISWWREVEVRLDSASLISTPTWAAGLNVWHGIIVVGTERLYKSYKPDKLWRGEFFSYFLHYPSLQSKLSFYRRVRKTFHAIFSQAYLCCSTFFNCFPLESLRLRAFVTYCFFQQHW